MASGVPHQPKFVMRPAVRSALSAEAVVAAVRTVFHGLSQMAMCCSDVFRMDTVSPESALAQEIHGLVTPQRPDSFGYEFGREVATRFADEHRDGAGVEQGLQTLQLGLPRFQILSQRR